MVASPAPVRTDRPRQAPKAQQPQKTQQLQHNRSRSRQSRTPALSVLMAAAVIAASGVYLVTAGTAATPAASNAASLDPLPPVASALKSLAGTVLGSPSAAATPAPGPSSNPAPQPQPSGSPAPAAQPSPSPSSNPGTGTGSAGSGSCGLTVKLVPTCSGALWGMADSTSSISTIEQKIGRPLTVVKEYHDFSGQGSAGAFPTAAESQLMKSGHILHFAWTAKLWSNQKATPSWKAIAAGKYDSSVVIPEAKRLAAVSTPFFIDWDHEMDGKTRSTWGTPADYVAAYRHIHAVFAQYGVDKAVWAWVPTGWSGNWNKVASYYPGNDVVDWIGWDPYNGSVKGWASPEKVFAGFYDWLDQGNLGSAAAAKPRMLGEYGSVGDPNDSSRRAQWLSQVPAALSALPQLRAVEYWNQAEFALNNTDFTGYTQAGHNQLAQLRG